MKIDEAKAISGTPRRDALTTRQTAEWRECMAQIGWPGSRPIRSREARQRSRERKAGH